MEDIDGYFEQKEFDGDRHIDKEVNLTSFFAQKYERITNQMHKLEKETDLAATKARSSVRNYGVKLRVERDLLRKFQGNQTRNQELAPPQLTQEQKDHIEMLKKAAKDDYIRKNDPESEFAIYMNGL